MKSQFFKVAAYSSKSKNGKRSAQQIVNEAMRIAGFCNHVSKPKTPKILYGESPIDAVYKFESVKSKYVDKAARKLRKDGIFLLSGVISFPTLKVEGKLINDCITFLKEHYGSSLKSVIAHDDESEHFHLHFYCIPSADEQSVFSIESVHPGIFAKNHCKGTRNQKDVAYKRAMQQQNEVFYNKVSIKHGFLLKSVCRERISDRNEYFQHQRQIKAIKKETKRLKEKSTQLIEDHVDNRIENVHLVNQQHYLKQNEQELREKNIVLDNRELKLQVKEHKNEKLEIIRAKQITKLRNLFTEYINKITTNPISVKDKIIIKLKKESNRLMKLISEHVTSNENLKSALLKKTRKNDELTHKLEKTEKENEKLKTDYFHFKDSLSELRTNRLNVLKLLKADKIKEAINHLTHNKYIKEEHDETGYAGHTPTLGKDLCN